MAVLQVWVSLPQAFITIKGHPEDAVPVVGYLNGPEAVAGKFQLHPVCTGYQLFGKGHQFGRGISLLQFKGFIKRPAVIIKAPQQMETEVSNREYQGYISEEFQRLPADPPVVFNKVPYSCKRQQHIEAVAHRKRDPAVEDPEKGRNMGVEPLAVPAFHKFRILP